LEQFVSLYSVSNLTGLGSCQAWGQSFTPADGGPDGEGAPDNTAVTLCGISVSILNYLSPDESVQIYLYNTPLNDESQIGQLDGLLGSWKNQSTGGSGSGASSLSVTVEPGEVILNSNQLYFIYFSSSYLVLSRTDSAYPGGALTDYDFSVDPASTAVFTVEMEDWPDNS
jgi:hypothetical protein